jgi:hypothetical protein
MKTAAVFVDRTGRRRRLFTLAGTGLAVAALIMLGLLVSGLSGASPLHLPGLPADANAPPGSGGRSPSHAGPVPAGLPSPSARARPTPSPAPGGAGATSAAAGSPAPTAHGRRPSARPGQSRRK